MKTKDLFYLILLLWVWKWKGERMYFTYFSAYRFMLNQIIRKIMARAFDWLWLNEVRLEKIAYRYDPQRQRTTSVSFSYPKQQELPVAVSFTMNHEPRLIILDLAQIVEPVEPSHGTISAPSIRCWVVFAVVGGACDMVVIYLETHILINTQKFLLHYNFLLCQGYVINGK